MKLNRAKQVIALYVVGEDVSEDDLGQAIDTANADEAYRKGLYATLKGVESPHNLCNVFLEHVAEFSEMTPMERNEEFPELVEHMNQCKACARAYWEIVSVWHKTQGNTKKTAALIFKLDSFGHLSTENMTRPTVVYFSKAMGSEILEWELEDEEAALTFHIAAESMKQDSHYRVIYSVDLKPWSEIQLDHIECTIVEHQTGRVFSPASLSAKGEGSYIIRTDRASLVFSVINTDQKWEIPLHQVSVDNG